MINPILGALGQSSVLRNANQIRQMINQLRSLGDPTALLQSFAQKDPELAKVLADCHGNYESAFRSYAKAKGIDPFDLMKQIQGLM